MKNNAIIRIIIWSIVIVLLLGLMGTAILGRNYFRSGRTILNPAPAATEVALETPMEVLPNEDTVSLDPSQVQEIEIEWAAGAILIQPADVTEIRISESDVSDEKYAMLWKLRDRELSIQFCEESIANFNFGITINTDLEKDLTIFVPRDWDCQSLEIDAASATVEINDLSIREVDIDTASGICRFDNCNVTQLDLDTASGDVTYVGDLDILDCDAASASVYAVLGNVPTRMDLDTMSGDLDITLPENAGFTVMMDAMSSDFTSDFETTMKNGHHIHGDGACRISVDAMSGDVVIRKAAASTQHQHTEACTANPNSCPDNAHQHTDTCTANPDSCPDTTQHHPEH